MTIANLLSGLATPAFVLQAAGKAYALAAETQAGKQVLRQVATRYEAARGKAPGNHDLEQALRLAGLTACLLLISQYRSEWEPEYAAERVSEPPFLKAAETWAYGQVDCCPLVAKTPDHTLIEGMHETLDAMLPASRAEDIANALGEVRQAAWDEMIGGAGTHAPPEFFEARFFGNSVEEANGGPDWGALYRALVQEALKDDARAETAFITSRLAGVRTTLRSLQNQLSSIKEDTTEILALVRQLSAEKGVPEEPLRKVLEKLGADHVPAAEIPAALESAADELVALRAQLARMPNDDRPEFRAIRETAQVHIDAGDFDKARAALQRGREAARDLRRQADMAEAQFLSAEARVDLLEQSSVVAREKFSEAAALNPDDCWLWFETGDLWIATGNTGEALAAYQQGKAAAERSGDDRDLSISTNKIGDILATQGNLTDALAAFRASLDIAKRLAKADPQNAGWQFDLGISNERVGGVQMALGNLEAALVSFSVRHAIISELAKADPQNAGWQRDLSVSHNKIGEVLVAQGNLTQALDAFRASHDIFERLAKADPQNAGWQRDLSVSHTRIGDVTAAQGNLTQALDAFRTSLEIRERLAKADPQNAGWQRDLSVSHERIANIHVANKDPEKARQAFESALRIYETLIEKNTDDLPALVFSVVPRWRLAELDPENARTHLQDALGILKPLADQNRLDANRLTWIPAIEAALESGES